MEANGPEPDAVAYTVLITCFAKSKWPERAMQLLEEMQSKGMSPDSITYGTLALACEKAGDEAKAWEFKEKEAECLRRIDPTVRKTKKENADRSVENAITAAASWRACALAAHRRYRAMAG